MTFPERPEDFSDDEYDQLCEASADLPEGVKVNPEYIRVSRGRMVGTGPYGFEIFDRSQPKES